MHEEFKQDLFDFKALYIIPFFIITLDWQSREQYSEKAFIHSFTYIYWESMMCQIEMLGI